MLVAMCTHETQDECVYPQTKEELVSKKRRIRINRQSHIRVYTPYVRADKSKARIPQMASGTISLARNIHSSPNIFSFLLLD